jgi:hypothetical protein
MYYCFSLIHLIQFTVPTIITQRYWCSGKPPLAFMALVVWYNHELVYDTGLWFSTTTNALLMTHSRTSAQDKCLTQSVPSYAASLITRSWCGSHHVMLARLVSVAILCNTNQPLTKMYISNSKMILTLKSVLLP